MMLTHKGTQTIRTPRLTLRQFTPDDAPQMFENWARDPRVTKYLTWQPHADAAATRSLLEDWCARYEQADHYNWAIEFEGRVIGNVSAVRHSDRNRNAELGYCMGAVWWNRGLMTEAVEAVIRYFFDEVGFHRVVIRHAVKNPGSGRVAQKCGLTREGVERESFLSADGEKLPEAEN